MRVLVTGANGYIGRYVVKELLDKGHEVYVSDIRYDDVDERAVRTDVEIFGNVQDVFTKLGSPDVCVHLAWRNGFVHNDMSHIDDFPNHYRFINNPEIVKEIERVHVTVSGERARKYLRNI